MAESEIKIETKLVGDKAVVSEQALDKSLPSKSNDTFNKLRREEPPIAGEDTPAEGVPTQVFQDEYDARGLQRADKKKN